MRHYFGLQDAEGMAITKVRGATREREGRAEFDAGVFGASALIGLRGKALNLTEILVCLESGGVILEDPRVMLICERHARLGILD